MARRIRALRPLALSLLAGAALAALAGSAEAQGKGRKSGHYKEKRVERELRRDDRDDRGGWRDGRIAVPRDDRDRYDDRRTRDRLPAYYGRSVGPTRVPPGQLPPPGLCRIWIDGVPPGRQPRPTDCATAQRYRPANARVLYGGAVRGRRDDDRYDDRYDRRSDDRYDRRSDDRYDDRYGRRRDDDRDERRRDDDRDDRRSDDRRYDDRRSDARTRAPGGYVDPRSLPRIRLP